MDIDINIDEYLEDLQTALDNGEEEKMYWQEDMQVLISELKETRRQMRKLKNKNKDLLRKLRNRIKEVNKLIKYSAYKKEFSRLNAIIKQKDKIINHMANFINDNTPHTRHTKELENEQGIRTAKFTEQYFAEQAKEVEE